MYTFLTLLAVMLFGGIAYHIVSVRIADKKRDAEKKERYRMLAEEKACRVTRSEFRHDAKRFV